MNKEKKSGDIENEIEICKNDKIMYELSYHFHYLMSLLILRYLKRYAKM